MARRLRDQPLLVAAALFLVVLAMRAWVQWIGPLPGDRWSAAHVGHPVTRLSESGAELMTFMAAMGTPIVAILAYVAALWFTARAAGAGAMWIVALAPGVVVVNALLK